MGWDHHSAISTFPSDSSSPTSSSELPDLTRSDNHSYHDLFTPSQLIQAFSLEHVNTKKAAVNLSKLDFINKMTLRRKAGALGPDGVMVDHAKGSEVDNDVKEGMEGHEEERVELVRRVQEMLRGDKLLKDK